MADQAPQSLAPSCTFGGKQALMADGLSIYCNGKNPRPSEVFSPMTSFTKCPETSFTLRRERNKRRSVNQDAGEDDGCPRATSEVRGSSVARGEAVHPFVRKVRNLSADWIALGGALSHGRRGRDEGAEPAILL
jgi:hypothetical protein